MTNGKLHSIETFGAVDGPGIRTVFFLQGCPARCIYCHNPDTWSPKEGRLITVDEVVATAKRGMPYYGSEGGVTFSGGEPLMQGKFLIEAIDRLAAEGINSIIDTSGTYLDEYTEKAIFKSQMLLLDIKHSDPMQFEKIAGINQRNLLQVIEIANSQNKPLWIRQVIVPNINDTEENIAALIRFIDRKIKNIYKVELLGYHNMAINKWDKLGLEYKLKDVPPMNKSKLNTLNQLI